MFYIPCIGGGEYEASRRNNYEGLQPSGFRKGRKPGKSILALESFFSLALRLAGFRQPQQ